MTPRQRLREKLSRELAQSEHSAIVHLARDARRLGETPPSRALLALADHARALREPLQAALGGQRIGLRIGAAVGELFSLTRHVIADRILDNQRSFRGDLLGVRHGIDVAHLLREVALLDHDAPLIDILNRLLAERDALVRAAAAELAWFAEHAEVAVA